MCLILFAINPNSRYRLVVAANRDELYARPTLAADFWDSHPDLLAGKDQNMGGTWLGVNRRGAFAAVTNFSEPPPEPLPPRSRGDLPTGYLMSELEPKAYLEQVDTHGNAYKGFNLIVASESSSGYYGNRAGAPRILHDGHYGLSNQGLDCDWPKVIEGRAKLADITSRTGDPTEKMFELLLGRGDGREFSNSFIAADRYGTRAATVVLITHEGEVFFEERNFGENGEPLGGNQFRFNCNVDS